MGSRQGKGLSSYLAAVGAEAISSPEFFLLSLCLLGAAGKGMGGKG